MGEDSVDVGAVRRHVSRHARLAAATGRHTVEAVPGVPGLWVQHLADGWVQLVFRGWEPTSAARAADTFLEPDAAPFFVSRSVSVFEGFAPEEEPGSAVPAFVPPGPPPRSSSTAFTSARREDGLCDDRS